MKKFVLSTLFLLLGLAASAQNVFKGTVVDKQGNPIASAKVEVVGTETSCLTNLDGTYRLEAPANSDMLKFSYLGMKAKTLKGKSDMTVVLRDASKLGGVYDNYEPVMMIQGLIPVTSQSVNPAAGIAFGQVKELGWYAKGLWSISNAENSYGAAIAGGMVRLGCPLYLYAGAGVGASEKANSTTFIIDAGLMLRLGSFFINAGTFVGLSPNVSIGIGCCL